MKKGSFINYIIGILLVVLGVFIIIRKDEFLAFLTIASGVVAIISGVSDIRVLTSIKALNLGSFITRTSLIKVIGNIIAGTLCVVMPLAMAQTAIRIVLYIVAVYLLFSGVLALIQTRYFKSKDERTSGIRANLIAQGIIFIAVSVFFFVTPLQIAYTVVAIIGVVVILIGAGVFLFTLKANSKDKVITASYTEADVTAEESADENK